MEKKIKIFINAGHGGDDPGAVGYVIEKDVNLWIAKNLMEMLPKDKFDVFMAAADLQDKSQSAGDVIAACDSFGADLAIDSHANSFNGKAKGFEIWVGISGLADGVAKCIEEEIKALGHLSRGIKTKKNSSGKDYFYFIRDTACAAMIIEAGFIDNVEDAALLDSEEKCKKFAEAYCKGIMKHYGVEGNLDKPVDSSNILHVIKKGETLTQIANEYNTTVDELAALNNIENVNLIIAGRVLVIPKPGNIDNTFKSYFVEVTAKIGLNVRREPEINSTNKITAIPFGTKVEILEERNNWGRISNGWICMDYVKKV